MAESIIKSIKLTKNVINMVYDDEHPCLILLMRRIASEDMVGMVMKMKHMAETTKIIYRSAEFEKMMRLTYVDQEKVVKRGKIDFEINVTSGNDYRMVFSGDIVFKEGGKPITQKLVRDDNYYLTLFPDSSLVLNGTLEEERIKPFGTFTWETFSADHVGRFTGNVEISVIEYMSPYAFLINVINRCVARLREFNLLTEIEARKKKVDDETIVRYYRCSNFSVLNPIADLAARHENGIIVTYTDSYRVQREPVFITSARPEVIYKYRDILVDRLLATAAFIEKNKTLMNKVVNNY